MSQLIEINNRFYKPAQIVMLATENPSNFLIDDDKFGTDFGKLLYSKQLGFDLFNEKNNFCHRQKRELYITSNEEIKEGDWFILMGNNGKKDYKTLLQCSKSYGSRIYTRCYPHFSTVDWDKSQCFKVLATTNTSSTINIGFPNDIMEDIPLNLSQPSKEFIQSFIESYNKGEVITDVLVEVEQKEIENWSEESGATIDYYFELKLKDNTIIIKKKEERVYTKQEVIEIIKQFNIELAQEVTNWDRDKFIKENL